MSKLYFILFLLVSLHLTAQPKIPFARLIWHENIDKQQKIIDKLDGKDDNTVTVPNDESATTKASQALYKQVDDIQNNIELDSSLDNNGKIKFLRGLQEALITYTNRLRNKRISAALLPEFVTAFAAAMQEEKRGKTIEHVVEANPIDVGEILLATFSFAKNEGVARSKIILLQKSLDGNPDLILSTLQNHPEMISDSLIKKAAYRSPEELYTYAQSATVLGKRINSMDEPLIKIIGTMANMRDSNNEYSGRLYFPFLDDLVKGRTSLSELEKSMGNKYSYYRLLVNTEIEYAGRFHKGDTPMVMSTLTNMLRKKAVEEFINVINGLHESPDNIRMKEVEPLNPQELYYLCVLGETEIYTSSYLKTYDRIFQRMKNPFSDSLLMSVNFDFYKKFIKMAAGYNTLDNFLKRMDKNTAEVLMRSFAGGLERTGNLEDAVDVADSYASLNNDELRKLILDEVKANYTELVAANNKRGTVIYDLLNNIFQSIDTSAHIDLSAKYGIPPVYIVPNESLRDTGNRIIIQQFFYGDKIGPNDFNNFVNAFSNSNWKIIKKPEWYEVSSAKGTPVTIYANRPLDEKFDLDAQAQAHLGDYLYDNGLRPTVVIHRGHSYNVKYTIDQLATSAKIVLLGSCGGYHNLHAVLQRCPYAHIIASKQVGSGTVNQPIIVALTDIMRQGKDLNWPELWKDFAIRFAKNDRFEDYVPPHKNLGAIFIMAYNKVLNGYKA